MPKIIPAILETTEENYHQKLLTAEHFSDLIQVDIIDGKFAKNVTVDSDIIKKFQSRSNLEIQLLVEYPQSYIDELASLECVTRFILPFELGAGLEEAIYHVRNHQKNVGLSLNPETRVEAAYHFFTRIDFLQLLAVNPGFSGQEFKIEIVSKIGDVKKLDGAMPVEIDGGVNIKNAYMLLSAGADLLAVNSGIFKDPDPYLAYEKLRKLAETASRA